MIADPFDDEIDTHDRELARTFLLYYTFEAWEKLLQMMAFVNAREHRRSRRKWAVINSFTDVLISLAKELDAFPVAYCRKLLDDGSFAFEDYKNAVKRVKEIIEALLTLHGRLDFLAGRAENQITYDFVRKLAIDNTNPKQDSWLPFVPSIALTDEYNFLEFDLRGILSDDLKDLKLEGLPPKSRNIVLALPKAEADNPLMWSILAHEIAHDMISSYKILENEIIDRTPEYYAKDTTEYSRLVYRNWSTEICADLIALRLLGPSYFYSFCSITMMTEPRLFSENYPTTMERIGVMAQLMTKYYPEWHVPCPGSSEPALTQLDLTSFFLRMARYKHALWSSRDFYPPGLPARVDSQTLSPKKLLIMKALDRVHVPISRLSSKDGLKSIFEALSSGQPVSAEPAEQLDADKFSAQLMSATTAEDLYAILPPPEIPLTLSTILACGWMLKIYSGFPALLKDLSNGKSLADGMPDRSPDYGRILRTRHDLLQNSLSRAFMMQMYWTRRGALDEQNANR